MIRNCNYCSTEYQAEARYVNRGQGLTCSRSCGYKYAAQLRTVEHKPNTSCGWCQAPLWRKPSALAKTDKFYCNKECMDFAIRSGELRTGLNSAQPRCIRCNKITFGANGKCRSCTNTDTIEAWLSGNNDVTLIRSKTTGLPIDTRSFVKRHLIETRGDKCEDCGFSGVNRKTGNSIIQMDHINGNCFDNTPENLKLLCPNCHAMTETYGSLNKGSGRAHRRKSGRGPIAV